MRAVDTSVVVPALLSWHGAHEVARKVTAGTSIAAHALVETYAVLTRLPGGSRVTPKLAAELLAGWFPPDRVLEVPEEISAGLPSHLAELGVAGGATYDALIALTAASHGALLLTRDERAVATYRLLGVDHELVVEAPAPRSRRT